MKKTLHAGKLNRVKTTRNVIFYAYFSRKGKVSQSMDNILATLIAATFTETTFSYERKAGTTNEKISIKGHPAALLVGLETMTLKVLQNTHPGDKEAQKETMRLLCANVFEDIDKGDGNGGM